jgi:DNA-3-methyladenine glycosylase
MHNCMNIVTEPEGNGAAVLLRAIEPVENVAGNTRGPGLLCKALKIDRSLNGADLCGDELYVARPVRKPCVNIVHRPRIGVDYAGAWAHELLRFYIEGNPWISRK